ncbi:MAG TPA: hypothetical protein VNM45_08865 [Bacillus sp. (in: firmicutes)]|nr:hypothetical protein [Bacillus sp. (in: firmicutes)]
MIYGLALAEQYGKELLSFDNKFAANVYYYEYRQNQLSSLETICSEYELFSFDFTPESLLAMEDTYFELCEHEAFEEICTTQEEFERAMGVYFGEVVIRNIERAEWVVQEYPIVEGKYTLGIRKGWFTLNIPNGFVDHAYQPQHEDRCGIYRKYLGFVNS